MRRSRSAFTLIELLIVVAIIAILAAIAVPNFLEAQMRAKVAKAVAHMRTLAVACEAFRVDHNHYVPNWSGSNEYPSFVQDRMDPLWTPRSNSLSIDAASLTSPIPYISGFISDPFLEAYAYYDSDHYVCDYAWMYGVDVTSAQAWCFASRGPDRQGERPAPGGASPSSRTTGCFLTLYDTLGPGKTKEIFTVGDRANSWYGSYDPTNGTVSRGNIVRLSY
jgi:prepilin-type N-terminal cleavage/methylation domain-containing protein